MKYTKSLFFSLLGCFSLIGCNSTVSSVSSASSVSTNNEKWLTNISGYQLIANINEANAMTLSYGLIIPNYSTEQLRADGRRFDLMLKNKEVFITATISHKPPLKVLPNQIKEDVKKFVNIFPNGDPKHHLAFKTCNTILSNNYTYIEMCSYDYKDTWDSSRGIHADDTDRVFFIGTFNQGKLAIIQMYNTQDFSSAYLAAKNIYQKYDTPISIAPYDEIFKNLDNNTITKAILEHNKKGYSVAKKLPPNFMTQIKNWALGKFKDPDSVKYKWDISKPLMISNLKTNNNEVIEHCFLSNAKNSVGGYTGYTLHKAIFINGKLDRVVINNKHWNEELIKDYCNPLNL